MELFPCYPIINFRKKSKINSNPASAVPLLLPNLETPGDTRFAIIPERLWYHISADTFTTETNTLAPDAPTLPTSVSMMGHIKVKTTIN